MIKGHGIDLQEIAAIKKACQKHPKLISKILTVKEEEQYHALSGKRQYDYLAGRWSAKEAFSKAMGTGMVGMTFHDLEILTTEKGKPIFTKAPFEGNIFVSISHSGGFVQASVILEEA